MHNTIKEYKENISLDLFANKHNSLVSSIEPLINRTLQQMPQQLGVYLNISQIQKKLDVFEKIISTYNCTGYKHRDKEKFLLRLALLYFLQEKYPSVYKKTNLILEFHPRSPYALKLKGITLVKDNKLSLAREVFIKILRDKPSDSTAREFVNRLSLAVFGTTNISLR